MLGLAPTAAKFEVLLVIACCGISLSMTSQACPLKEGAREFQKGNKSAYAAVARVQALGTNDGDYKLAEEEARVAARVFLHRKLPESLRGPGPEALQGVSVTEVCRDGNFVVVTVEASEESVALARQMAEATRNRPVEHPRPSRNYGKEPRALAEPGDMLDLQTLSEPLVLPALKEPEAPTAPGLLLEPQVLSEDPQ